MNIQSSFYRSVNDIERAPRSNLARLPAISSFWTLFVGIHATERKSCTGVHEGHSTAAVQRLSSVCHLCPQYQLSIWQQLTPTFTITIAITINFIFGNFIPTYHSLHVCGRQTLLCARLTACRVPLVLLPSAAKRSEAW